MFANVDFIMVLQVGVFLLMFWGWYSNQALEKDDARLTISNAVLVGLGAVGISALAVAAWRFGGGPILTVCFGAFALLLLRVTVTQVRKALSAGRTARRYDAARDAAGRGRARAFGDTTLSVGTDRIMERGRYRLHDLRFPVIVGLLMVLVNYRWWSHARSLPGWLSFLQAPMILCLGTIAGGIAKARRWKPLLDMRDGCVRLRDERFGRCENARVVVSACAGAYQVRLGNGDNDYNTSLMISVPTEAMAEEVAGLVRELLERCSDVWPPPPTGTRRLSEE